MQDCVITKEFCNKLDQLLIPVIGEHFNIIRDSNGKYFFQTASGRVISIRSEQHPEIHAAGKKDSKL